MRAWLFLLGGLIVWTIHFFMLYGFASIFLTTTLARVLTLLTTLVCIGADLFLLRMALHHRRTSPTDRFIVGVALGGIGVSLVAIVWQALPAFLI